LTVNTGSSSVKLAVYAGGVRQWSARSGLPFAPAGLPPEAPEAIAHRIVAPLEWSAPRRLDAATLAELQSVTPLVPDHLPQALAAMAACAQAYPGVPQVGCSDSAFHHTMLEAARAVPVPGAPRRFGYHGLSCEYIVSVVGREARRLVIAHLGSGCSVTAVRDGRSLDNSMGFTPLGGLVMSTRPGDLDPGVLVELLRSGAAAPADLNRVLNQGSGLLALSRSTGDMKMLLDGASRGDARAQLAVEVFVHSARKHVGAMIAVLDGVDLVVFTGGIGENAAALCARIAGRWPYRVVPTDEDLVLARHTETVLQG